MLLQLPEIFYRAYPCPQFLNHNCAEVLKGTKDPVKLLEFEIHRWVAKPLNEQIAIKDVLVFSPTHTLS